MPRDVFSHSYALSLFASRGISPPESDPGRKMRIGIEVSGKLGA
jgi:hypothetical protein